MLKELLCHKLILRWQLEEFFVGQATTDNVLSIPWQAHSQLVQLFTLQEGDHGIGRALWAPIGHRPELHRLACQLAHTKQAKNMHLEVSTFSFFQLSFISAE
jgi:hypothetical protein